MPHRRGEWNLSNKTKKYLKIHKLSDTERGKQRWSHLKGPEMIEEPLFALFKLFTWYLSMVWEYSVFQFDSKKPLDNFCFQILEKRKLDVFYSSAFV